MVSVRILGALGFILAAGEAQASSIIVLGVPSSAPSVVALGAVEPDVTYEKVATIPNQPEHERGFMPGPMIIRGGIVGGDFSTPAPSAAPATAAAAPQAGSGNKTEATNSPPAPQPTPIAEADRAK